MRSTTVRVFISSTFRDMQAERDHLVKVVFPALRETLAPHRIDLIDIDLRWGVTREEAESAGAVALCLSQVDECRPFFLGILGERYGWIPTKLPPAAIQRHSWLAEYAKSSVTELEIVHAVLREPAAARRAFFCFRDPAVLDTIPSDRRGEFVETNPDHARRLGALKQAIRDSGLPLADRYPARWDPHAVVSSTGRRGRLTGLDEFGRRIHDQLLAMIGAELEIPNLGEPLLLPALDQTEDERDVQDRYVAAHLRAYVGRDEAHRQLIEYVDGDRAVPCVVSGARGCGKSAVLARLVDELRTRSDSATLLWHFAEAHRGASGLRDALARLGREMLAAGLGARKQAQLDALGESDPLGFTRLEIEQQYAIGETIETVAAACGRLLRMLAERAPVVVVLDLDAGASDEGVTSLWLPELPRNVRFVLSANRFVEPIVRSRAHVAIDLQPLAQDERRAIIQHVPSLSAKRLDDRQTNLLLKKPATETPLFLRVALEELRGFGSYEQLTERIRSMPDGKGPDLLLRALTRVGLKKGTPRADPVVGLFRQVLARLEADFHAAIVELVIAGLTAAHRGLSETELRELASGVPGKDDLFPLLRQLRPYLVLQNGLLAIQRVELRGAAEDRWMRDEKSRADQHRRLADYFDAQPFRLAGGHANRRKVDELPHHLRNAGERERMVGLLFDIQYVETKIESRLAGDLAFEYRTAVDYKDERWSLCSTLHDAIRRMLATLEPFPELAFQTLWNACVASEDPQVRAVFDRWLVDPNRTRRLWLRSLRPDPEGVGTPEVWVHGPPVESLATSPNGSLMAAAGGSKVSVWETRFGGLRQVIHTPSPVKGVALYGVSREFDEMLSKVPLRTVGDFFEASDWKPFVDRIAYAIGGAVLVTDLWSGEHVSRFEHDISSDERVLLAFAPVSITGGPSGLPDPKGHLIASSAGSTIAIWNAQTGERLHVLETGFSPLDGLTWRPDGGLLLASGFERSDDPDGSGTWSVRGWLLPGATPAVHSPGFDRIEYPRDSTRVVAVSSGRAHNVEVYDATLGKAPPLFAHLLPISIDRLAISEDGGALASVAHDNAITEWDLDRGEVVQTYPVRGASSLRYSRVTSLVFLRRRRLAAAYEEGVVTILASWMPERLKEGHTREISSLRWSPDGTLAATAAKDNTVRLWAADGSLKDVLTFERGATDIAFSPDSRRIAILSEGTCYVWQVEAGGEDLQIGLDEQDTLWAAIDFTADGRRVAISRSSGKGHGVSLVDIEARSAAWTVAAESDADDNGWEQSVACSPDGRLIATGARNCRVIRLWSTVDGKAAGRLEIDGSIGAMGADTITWSPDSRYLSTICRMMWSTTLWDISTLAMIRQASIAMDTSAAAGNPDAFVLGQRGLVNEAELIGTDPPVIFPRRLSLIAAHPNGRLFAAAVGADFYILQVEDERAAALGT